MGGLVKDAFTAVNGGEKFLFSTVLKHRKTLVDKITSAIANVKLRKEELFNQSSYLPTYTSVA